MGDPFHRGALIPFWALQLIFVLISLGDSAYLLSVWANGMTVNQAGTDYNSGYSYYYSTTYSAAPILIAFYALVVAFSVVTVILLITEIVLFARKRLLPKTFFAFQLTNFLLWTVLFAMAIAGIVIGYDSILIIVSVVIAWVCMIGTLIYSSIMFRRHRAGSANYGGTYGSNFNPGGHDIAA